ncbi:hypothetical protein NC653_031675 [Populus alba x Populus x berolinensis]|uniref:Pentatricopeptide repeat-containing protein n=1 Tax=Populus alba x Populus x berolinensis TaxID=444605 RepID=A0AAD6Q1U7_9ROSI|nr:hypothetical protein NC653_031675 [Populus alba x Populus x berolinensis]
MKLLLSSQRHYSTLASLNLKTFENPQSKAYKIIQYCKSGSLFEAIHVLNSIDWTRLSNKPFFYASLLQTCTKAVSFTHGIQFHAHVIKSGLDTDRFVGNSLLALYFKLGPNLFEARRVFDGLFYKDLISWTSMITGYVKVEKPKKSLELFLEMLGLGIEPNGFTLSATSIISAFTRNDAYDKALGFFYSMCRKHGLSPDGFTFGTVLTACGNLGRLKQGKEVHAKVIASGLSGNVFVESSLVDMYGKCRLVNQSQCVFDRMSVKNLVSWTALLGGYCQNGDFESVIRIFREDEMIEEGIRPDYISFVGVLFACSHVGLVDQGKKYFAAMSEVYEIKPGIEHYNCMIDLLGRAGLLEEAENLIENANCRDEPSLWTVLLGACAASPHSATAERIAKKAVELKPDHHLSYVYLANVYRAVGRWDDAVKIRNLMTKRGVGKMPGTSWIET